MTVAEAIRKAATRLAQTSDTARLDAEVLMAHALGCSRSDVLLRHMQADVPGTFDALVERRLAHEPVAYITGTQEFYGLDLIVSPAVLIPRSDSETLIEAAREAFMDHTPRRILDLGTGSGALLLAALSIWPDAESIGIDRSVEALAIASANGAHHAPSARFVPADWTKDGWSEGLGTFDLILANPPYVELAAELSPSVRAHEPAGALFAGADGMDDYRLLVPQLPGLLSPDGIAMVEIGWTQGPAVMALVEAAGMTARLHRDLGSRPRAVEMAKRRNIPLGKAGTGD
ncbi:peptide chain release factor N(5)-glutamine methyltransferase [Novosphingobium sp. MMS21-SN21R]|uniref:peptide chain release factor N(5)-glutamine methyltransferase n=1 Tax=Novosphingobium sp. MMS21-SN21R TaxID=2969298 RepID=UPI002884CC93|nr:peptide chain release factor N(5)-glutamine methyltransferase [Novosphingobium sp. MMS21-SN21R]MDT0506675.1 peptide chain release factor N(5)-glutamine methyltransferase [Novosphingobium sp. MMS21-SN21R]